MYKGINELFSVWARLPYARMLAWMLAVGCMLLRNEVLRLNHKLDVREDTITALRIGRTKEIMECQNEILQKQKEAYILLQERLKTKEEREKKLDSMLFVNYEYLRTRKMK
ncbi:MAG TPA: hypothetical protein VL098_04890 [Flavipsychrobacter sp.]|nr:hypothetical protein [Flavipsychrobacter sp.]